MNSRTVIGGTRDGAAFCIDCMHKLQTVRSIFAYNAIFAGDEWDHKPTCDICGELIECAVIGDIDNE